jgi:hypothetical protein
MSASPTHCCGTCSEVKPAEGFFKNSKNKTGRNTHECKVCYAKRANLEVSRPPSPLAADVARRLMDWLLGRKPTPAKPAPVPAPKPKAAPKPAPKRSRAK